MEFDMQRGSVQEGAIVYPGYPYATLLAALEPVRETIQLQASNTTTAQAQARVDDPTNF